MTASARSGGLRPAALAGLPLLEDLPDVRGLGVLVRVDFNVPLVDDGDPSGRRGRRVSDDYRIRTALPTLRWLLARGAAVTACSHLGRPPDAFDPRWTMDPVRARLEELLPGVALLENLRFSPGEKHNDAAFVDALVAGQDLYVNEAFSASHREHASIVGPPARLPSAGGVQLAREVEVLGGLLESPARPFVAIVGGAKTSDKLGVLQALAERVDVLLVGGAMAFTFLLAQGHAVGSSLVEPASVEACAALLAAGTRIVLPSDVVALSPDDVVSVVGQDVPESWRGLDIGPETARRFAAEVAGGGTVLWNGPLGVVEDERFARGTAAVAAAVAACPGFTVVGGGDSVGALDRLGLSEQVDFLSTGGGASLEYLEEGDLPGLAALRAASNAPGGRT